MLHENGIWVNGVLIKPSPYVTDYTLVRRTWKERLFTLPWRPFQKIKTGWWPRVYILPKEKVGYCSYRTWAELVRLLRKDLTVSTPSTSKLSVVPKIDQ